MTGSKTRNEIWYYSIFGAVVLAGTVALMLFGVNSRVSDDIGPLIVGLVLSTYVFRFGLPWRWLNFAFLASFLVVGLLLGQPGLMWMGGYLAGAQFGVAWRLAAEAISEVRMGCKRSGYRHVDRGAKGSLGGPTLAGRQQGRACHCGTGPGTL
jgi:hypothetical protein